VNDTSENSNMNTKQVLILVSSMLTPLLCGCTLGDETQGRVVRVAKLQIDASQLESCSQMHRQAPMLKFQVAHAGGESRSAVSSRKSR